MISDLAIVPRTGFGASPETVAPVSPAGRGNPRNDSPPRRTFRYTPPHPADLAATYGARGRLHPRRPAITGIIVDIYA